MSLMRKLAVLGAAAEAARRYAQKNPDKAREFADKAAQFADQRTNGKYAGHIETARRKLADVGGFADGPQQPVRATAVVDPIEPAGSTASTPRPTPYKRG